MCTFKKTKQRIQSVKAEEKLPVSHSSCLWLLRHRQPLIGRPTQERRARRGACTSASVLYERPCVWPGAEQRPSCSRHLDITLYTPRQQQQQQSVRRERSTAAAAGPNPRSYFLAEAKRRVKVWWKMQSVYQHLISLLFVFGSLHVDQLTEGCSCAPWHPQDAFCNSEIGEWSAAATSRVYRRAATEAENHLRRDQRCCRSSSDLTSPNQITSLTITDTFILLLSCRTDMLVLQYLTPTSRFTSM